MSDWKVYFLLINKTGASENNDLKRLENDLGKDPREPGVSL